MLLRLINFGHILKNSTFNNIKIVYGIDSINIIDRCINNRKALLITSPGFVERGLIDKIKAMTNTIVFVVSDVRPHPQFRDLESLYNKISGVYFEVILAIGGGSVIDSAKFLSVTGNSRTYDFVEKITKEKLPKKSYSLTPIISVPTTAGTGSEVTPYATVWDQEESKKYSLHLPDLFCEFAIYDPALTLSVPMDVTIQTGLDSLSHALESIWNKNANDVTIGYAIKSARLIIKNLVELTNNLNHIARRSDMMLASMYAGMAISKTQTAIAHAASYYITLSKGVPHGIACSFTLPMLIDNIIGKYDFIDDALIEIFGELSSDRLRGVLHKLNVSTEFEYYGIGDSELKKLRASLSSNQRAKNSLVSF